MAAAAASGEMTGLDYDAHHLRCSPTLRFSVGAFRPNAAENARCLIGAVDSAVAARAEDGPDVEALEASFVYAAPYHQFIDGPVVRGYVVRHDHAADITSAHLARWLRFAARRVTGSFVLLVPTVPTPASSRSGRMSGLVRQQDVAAVREIRELYVELPASARAETMSLTLGDAELTVPGVKPGAFSALTDLFLSHCLIEPGEGANLGRMLSPTCCPQLRRLRLEYVSGLHELRLEAAGTMEDLWLDHLRDMSVLHVDAPGLRSLHILGCTKIAEVTVLGSALETLGYNYSVPPDGMELPGAASVRRLEKLHLSSHGFLPDGHQDQEYTNAGVARLLESCTAVESLDVSIWPPDPYVENAGGMAELICLLPHHPSVTDLNIEACASASVGTSHRLGHCVARLVARCVGLRRLSVAFLSQYYHGPCEDPNCFCSPPAPEMETLKELLEAKIVGFRPLPDHLGLVRELMAKAPALEKMTVQFNRSSEDDGELPLPCHGGNWARSATSSDAQPAYEWTPAASVAAP